MKRPLKLPWAAAENLRGAWETEGDEELALKAELISRDIEIRERLNRERLDAQVAQVQRARAVTRFSPAAIVQYALESMAGTGFNRHFAILGKCASAHKTIPTIHRRNR